MAEVPLSQKDLAKDRQRAAGQAEKSSAQITDPLARFNLGLGFLEKPKPEDEQGKAEAKKHPVRHLRRRVQEKAHHLKDRLASRNDAVEDGQNKAKVQQELQMIDIDNYDNLSPQEKVTVLNNLSDDARLELHNRRNTETRQLQLNQIDAHINGTEDPKPLAEPTEQELQEHIKREGIDGQKINMRWLNRAGVDTPDGKRVLVYLPQYLSNTDKGTENNRMIEAVRQTGRSVIGIDFPQFGNSDKLTRKQKKALEGPNGFRSVGESQLLALKKLLDEHDIKDIDIVGGSMGALAAVALIEKAQEFGLNVDQLMIYGSPGVEGMKATQLMGAEGKDGKLLDLYQSTPYDPEMRVASEQTTPIKRLLGFGKLFKDLFVKDPKIRYVRAMAKESFEKSLDTALDKNPKTQVQYMYGTEDSVNPVAANRRIIDAEKTKHPGRVHEMFFSGENHVFLENGKRFGEVLKLALQKPDSPAPIEATA